MDEIKRPLWKRIVCTPELYLALVALVLGVLCCLGHVAGKNAIMTINDSSKKVVFPIMEKMDGGQFFKVAFDIESSTPYDLRVIPDDCVRSLLMNGAEVPLTGISGLCNYHQGFLLKSENLNITGKDHYEFMVQNSWGPGGFNIEIVRASASWGIVVEILFLVVCLILLIFILKRIKLGFLPVAIISLGIIIRIVFALSLPGPTTFAHDVDGHLSYVQYVAENKAVPANDQCWTCYHPPVYYVAMAPIWTASSTMNLSGSAAVQMASFVMSILILIFGYLVLQKVLSGAALHLAGILWTFWPVLILSATRIGNEQLFYLFHILCLWGGLKYVRDHSVKHILFAAVVSLLAVWTKSTGLISIGLCGLCFMLGYFPSRVRLLPTKGEVATALVLFGTVVTFVIHLVNAGGLVSNASGLHGGLKVGNDFVNFLYIDIQQLLANPYTSPWDDNLGRTYFGNYLYKTSLFGEFTLLGSDAGRRVAQAMNVSLLLLFIYAGRGLWKSKFNRVNFVLWVQGIAFVIAIAYLRYKYPFSCSNDFRYILPVLLSAIPLVAMGETVPGSSVKWKVLGGFLIAVFTICTIALMVMTALNFK